MKFLIIVNLAAIVIYSSYLKSRGESRPVIDLQKSQILLLQLFIFLLSFLLRDMNTTINIQIAFQFGFLVVLYVVEIKMRMLMQIAIQYKQVAKHMIFLHRILMTFLCLIIALEMHFQLHFEQHIFFLFINVSIVLLIYYQYDALLKSMQELDVFEIKNILEQKIKHKIDEIRSIQHEYGNLLSVFQFSSLQIENIISADFLKDQIFSVINYEQRGQALYPLVRALLYAKGEQAKQLDIQYQVKIEIDQKDLFIKIIEEHELLIILSNLIDNAIEQILRERNKGIDDTDQIRVELIQKDRIGSIGIGSTRSDFTTEEYLTYMADQYTTKDNAMKHGFGLMRVKDIVDAYQGKVEAIKKDRLQFVWIRFSGGDSIVENRSDIASHCV